VTFCNILVYYAGAGTVAGGYGFRADAARGHPRSRSALPTATPYVDDATVADEGMLWAISRSLTCSFARFPPRSLSRSCLFTTLSLSLSRALSLYHHSHSRVALNASSVSSTQTRTPAPVRKFPDLSESIPSLLLPRGRMLVNGRTVHITSNFQFRGAPNGGGDEAKGLCVTFLAPVCSRRDRCET